MKNQLRCFTFALIAALPAVVSAQGNLSTLGFGYPTGQLSTRALGSGGSTAEIDPLSAANPAALLYFGGSALYFQAEPEYRTLNVSGATERTSITRFPLVSAAIPVNARLLIGLSASNFLERTFINSNRGTTRVADSLLAVTNNFKSDGAIGDLRVAAGFQAASMLKLGVGLHAILGDNRVSNVQVFDDSTRFARLSDTATVGYTGNAVSAGFEFTGIKDLSIAGSYRYGGSLSTKRGDTTIAKAHVPDHYGVALSYLGVRGSAIGFRTSHDTWTRMRGLGSASLNIFDAWDSSLGADMAGPRIGDRTYQLRAGYRWRTLPFSNTTTSISEKTVSGGIGTYAAQGRAGFDMTLMRAFRDAHSSISETAWTLSLGLTVRP